MTSFKPIVRSLAETDFYKITMQKAMLHRTPQTHAVYEFVCRNTPEYPLAELEADVNRELDHLCELRYTPAELQYFASKPYLAGDYIDFLRLFQFQREFITVKRDGDKLAGRAAGPQVHVMGFEIFVLYIVSELYMRRFGLDEAIEVGMQRARQKVAMLKEFGKRAPKRFPFEFFDFGLRRRHSAEMQERVIELFLAEVPEFFKGTSNVYLAMKYGIPAIGSQAHEWFQSHQQMGYRLRDFQKAALENWVQEFRGDLGIALTDVVGIDAFLADLDRYLALLFDGYRHDSGDPKMWGDKLIARLQELRVNADTKRLVFSDGLDFPTAFDLHDYFGDRAMTGFGIGTNLMNDSVHKPLNLVMKLVELNGGPVAKLSDSPGKLMCRDEGFVNYLRQVFNKYD